MTEKLHLPDQHMQPGISGVQHGPYPKTALHPFDNAEGNTQAIRAAWQHDRIDDKLANELQTGVAEEVRKITNPDYEKFVKETFPDK